MIVRKPGWKRTAKQIESNVRCAVRPIRDAWSNWRHHIRGERFLVIRHRHGLPSYYRNFLKWIAVEFPDIRRLFELRLLPEYLRDWSPYRLAIPWLPDTLLYCDTAARAGALQFAVDCDLRQIPIINRPEALLGTSKSDTARSLRRIGLRTPHMQRLDDRISFEQATEAVGLPFLIRDDLAHGRRNPIRRVENRRQWHDLPWRALQHPMAVEFIDVRSPIDKLYRKFRYMAVGKTGISHTLQISREWEVRAEVRILNQDSRGEEIAYAEGQDPNHDRLQQACRILGLDFCGLDYSYTPSGDLVVWEVNGLPDLSFPDQADQDHLRVPIERTMAATLRLYLDRAGFEIPDRIERWTTNSSSASVSTPVAVSNTR